MVDLSNRQLGQYQLIEVIARGGMAVVYKAHQPSLERYVAVKVMTHDRDPQFASRFKREARAIAQLQHHNILPIYDYGEQDGLLYLVLQYIEQGATLGDIFGAPLEPEQALRLISHVLRALEYAHSRGIIHRDIKPANVLMPSPDWPMLADFGIAKLLNDDQQRLTVPGLIVGTAAYMAPEQATGQPIDARTDIYATGIMLYEMLTGRVPFDAETPIAVLTNHVYDPPPPPRSLNPNLSIAIENAVLRAIAKDPAARFQTAGEMAAELDRLVARIDQDRKRTKISSLYQVGVAAFEAGHWDEAIQQLDELVGIDPDYQDAPELLELARTSRDRQRTEARQQLDLVRQRRSTMHQQVQQATGPSPAAANSHATTRFPLDEQALLAAVAAPQPEPSVAVPQPAGGSGPRYAIWAIGALLILALLGFVVSRFIGAPATAVTPTSVPAGGAATAAAAPTAAAPTAAAATSAPAAASEPAPEPAGSLVYQSDFNAAASNPLLELAQSGLRDQIRNVTDFERGFHAPGVYHFRILGSNVTYSVLLPHFLYGDLSIQYDVWDNSDNLSGDVAEGIVFRARDAEHLYAVLLDPRKRQFAVRKRDGRDNWSDIIAWKESPLIKADKDVNQLRVDAAGDTFKLYLNGFLLDQFSDQSYATGMVGMVVANVDAAQPHIHFDNLKIWAAAPAPADPGAAPERADPNGDMVLIPGGEFILGGNESDDAQSQVLELPNFYIDRTEVTNAAYARCVAAGKCTPQSSPASRTHPSYATDAQYANFPAINVSWAQAQSFCGWAQKRLPTEAEWEKAASWNVATHTKTIWPFGNEFDPAKLNSDESKTDDTVAVGQYSEEINHTFDMSGNVREWTNSLMKPFPYDAADGREDAQASGARVYRGGSWAQTQGKAKSIYRESADPATSFNEIGFRCAATP
jgi:formylglycine-generating enzyme required for sulfatase activity